MREEKQRKKKKKKKNDDNQKAKGRVDVDDPTEVKPSTIHMLQAHWK